MAYEGKAENLPPAAKGLKALHRGGLTFITWQEIEDPFGAKLPTLDELNAALKRMDAARQVRYRVYRHSERIDRKSIAEAELLAEVAPLSGYNVRGVSTDHVIHQRQLRAIEDVPYARSIARDPFKVSPETPEMGAIPVRRLAIEDGKPLAPGVGLYVHQPEKAGRAYYAVVTCVDGIANMVDLASGSSLVEPVAEETGPGEPVFQNVEDLKAFYDYAGQRLHYVQWCSPAVVGGMSATRDTRRGDTPPTGEPLALGIYFQDRRGFYLRPRWPHKAAQVLIATADSSWPSFGYGYHESLGTLAGTAALHYGLRHADEVAWIVAGYFDASPGTCPPTVQSDRRMLKTHLPQLEAVWGKRQWDIKNAAGVSIWKDRDLTRWVRANPKASLPGVRREA